MEIKEVNMQGHAVQLHLPLVLLEDVGVKLRPLLSYLGSHERTYGSSLF